MEAVALVVALAFGASALAARHHSPQPTDDIAAAPTATLSLARPRALPDTAPLGTDARDIRTFDAWIDHPGYAVTPQGILAAYREAERGYPQRQCDLFDDLIENDCHLRNLFEQREQAVSGKPWVIQADGTDGDSELAARVLHDALRRLPIIPTINHLLTFNRYGWSACEVDWGLSSFEGQTWIVPTCITAVPARRFRISTASNELDSGGIDDLRLYVDATRPTGDELRPGKWIVLRRSGTWISRAALMRSASWPAMAKRFGFRDWLIYSQRYGLPFPVATYNVDDGINADDKAIDVAEQMIRRIGSDGGAVVPSSIKLDFQDATSGDNSKTHGGLIAHCNAEMSKLINGSTLSNDNAGSGGASYALGEVHASVRWDNVLFDAERVQEAFRTQVFVPFMRFNALRGAAPLLKTQVVRDLDPKTRSEIADTLKNKLGIEISSGQLRQELGFREPAGDEDAAPGAPQVTSRGAA